LGSLAPRLLVAKVGNHVRVTSLVNLDLSAHQELRVLEDRACGN
jgi:hypothetical protein